MNEEIIKKQLTKLTDVKQEIAKVIVGQETVVNELMISLLAGGHCLLEGVPGLAKTLLVSTLAKTLDLQFNRVQFTPDLMPSDIVGTEILEEDHSTGKRFFKFQKGPIFTNIFLADEINRTPPKTQAALLEAMQEKQVSYGGKTYDLPAPFFVLATQNPVEQSGTYPLPEAQLDRFLMFIRVEYPNQTEEIEILKRTTDNRRVELNSLLSAEEMVAIQGLAREIEISDSLLEYITNIVRLTRPAKKELEKDQLNLSHSNSIHQYITWGAGPRAGQALVLCAKANALLEHRYSVTLADIAKVAPAVLRHRILLNFQAEADKVTSDDVIKDVLESVKQPQSKIS
ncbi:MAG: AAA family ATPase [Gammaproteobacteria bacterium]|nr:MAG: AAA family ATPase [Gammaproteobacteria bacterium]